MAGSKHKISTGLLAVLSALAHNVLLSHGILTLQTLSQYTEKEILSFHSIGLSFKT